MTTTNLPILLRQLESTIDFFIYIEFGSDLVKFCRDMFIDLVQIKYWKVIASLLKIGDKKIKMAFLIGLSLLTLSSVAHYFGIFIAPVQIQQQRHCRKTFLQIVPLFLLASLNTYLAVSAAIFTGLNLLCCYKLQPADTLIFAVSLIIFLLLLVLS